MRRRRLRDRIRHQRRLTRRLTARHVLARRAHPAARLLDALGAWLDDDELTGTHRFVPPLLDAAAIANTEPAHALASIAAEPVSDLDDFDSTLTDDDIGMDAVDLPNAQTAPWPVPEMAVPRPVAPLHTPQAAERSLPDAADARRVATKPATPMASPAERSPAPTPTLRPTASVDRERGARPTTPAAPKTADRPVPIVARPDSVAARRATSALDAPAPTAPGRPSPSVNTARSALTSASSAPASDAGARDITDVVDTLAQTSPNAGDVTSRDAAASVPAGHAPQDGSPVVENATAAEPPTPTERTAHSEVLRRALGALRASGELPPTQGQPTAGRQSSAGSQPTTAPVAAPPTRPAPPTLPSRTAAPSLADRKGDAPPPAARPPLATSGRLTSDDPGPHVRSSADETLPDALSAPAVSQPPSTEAAGQSVDAPQAVDAAQASNAAQPEAASLGEQPRLAANLTGRDTSFEARDSAASQAAPTPGTNETVAAPDQQPRSDERSAVSSPGLRIDERRQARRPAHLDRARPDAPASTPASAQTRDTSPPLSRGPDPSSIRPGQFQFADTERTVKDWQRLLFEATNPPRPGARREPTRVPDNRATAKAPSPPSDKPGTSPTAARSGPPGATRPQPVPDRVAPRPTNVGAARPAPNAPPSRTEETSQATRTAAGDAEAPIAADEPIVPSGAALRATDSPRNEPPHEPPREPQRPLTPAAVADAMRAMPAEPVAPSTRRFLRPLVGIDPNAVRIHRGEQAARLADTHDADAIAVGDDIALAAGHDERDPETIGLLAHELTHVARERDRRFVPPIARGGRATTPSAPSATGPARGGVRPPSRPSTSVDAEEVLAEGVEAHVRAATHQREREQTFTVTPNADLDAAADLLDDEPASDASVGAAPAPSDPRPRHSAPAARSGDARQSPWGALPAPWEPLPATLVPSRSPDARPPASAPPVSSDPPESAESAESPPAVHRAARGAGSAGEEPAHAEHPAQAGAAPDIDALARQVYTVLKRRLAAESRRGA